MKCPECGGIVVPLACAGRTTPYRKLKELQIPEDFEIPTCDKCGEEYINAELAEALDAVLEIRYNELIESFFLC